jgi:methylthioribose-1-phosphate isomerase
MAGALMRKGCIQVCVVGADRVATNGDVVNKIGTYSLAVLARAHGVPFYVAAPRSTIDPAMPDGDGIPIEERDIGEVANVLGMTRITPEHTEIYNPAFDMTPAELITGIITERGIFRPNDLARGMLEC